MANQPQQRELPAPRTYSRTEFTALRARVKGLSIARAYFDAETTEPLEVERLLHTMRDDLVAIALRQGSSVPTAHLQASIAKHGEVRLTPVTLQLIEEAAGQWASVQPAAEHAITRWFRALIAERLAGEGIRTLGELVAFINRPGGSWWRSVPRIGVGRARVLVAGLRRHATAMGQAVEADVELTDPLAAPATSATILVTIGAAHLAPLERLAVPEALSGARGANRAPGFAYVRAAHDLDAVRAYLHRYDDRPQTQRAYQRELERLVLWCEAERGVALSSMTVEDCEAYKAFLKAPGERFTGPPVARASRQWRPFAPGGLSPQSQHYAVRAIHAAFTWFVHVRYLAGNPWQAVTDPVTVTRVRRLQVERALSLDLWTRMRATLAERAASLGPEGARWRAARALLLVMGDGGLRIAEAAAGERSALAWLPADDETPARWLLEVMGKGMKQRYVPVSDECVDAIGAIGGSISTRPTRRAHWWHRSSCRRRHGPARNLAMRRTTYAALEVVQQTLGHASLGTTSIYISPEQTHLRREAAKYHARLIQQKAAL